MRWPRGTAERDPNPAASMALLDEVLDPPLGPGYHSAAEDRVAAGLPASSGTRTWLMFATSVVVGIICTVAAVTLRTPDPAAAEGREQVIARIEAAQEVGDEQRLLVEQLRAEVGALEQQALATEGTGDQIAAAAVQAGAIAVRGPGVEVTLADAEQVPDAAPGDEADPERVNARDLQLVVNGLWLAGAEAVSINEHRLTSTSAIRFAGQAIIVDFRGLTPPYVVRAIGDPDALARETSSGLTGAYLAELRQQLGLQAEVSSPDAITIGAAERLITRVGAVATLDPGSEPTPGLPSPDPLEER